MSQPAAVQPQADPQPRTNWAGNVTYRARRCHRPSSVGELQDLVARSSRIRALGTGHSFNRIADIDGDQVTVAGITRPVDVDADAGTVTVPAGIRYGELARTLHAQGWALPNLGSLPHISVAGACATGTHGSGTQVQGATVRGMRMVTADGGLVDLAADDSHFPGAVISLGMLGVVTELTLAIEPTYDVRQWVYEDLPVARLLDSFDEISASAYSVSVFTDWQDGTADQVWRKHRISGAQPAVPERWLGARLADGPRHPVRGIPPVHCTAQLGAPGPWYERLPHFRLDFTPSAGAELQSEYLLPREHAAAAFDAVLGLAAQLRPVLQISEIRTVAADELWLSPAYRQDSVAVHFTWIDDPDAVAPVVAAVEHRLTALGARPHWAKIFQMPADVVAARYPRLDDVRRLVRDFDPGGTFSNNLTAAYVTGTA